MEVLLGNYSSGSRHPLGFSLGHFSNFIFLLTHPREQSVFVKVWDGGAGYVLTNRTHLSGRTLIKLS